MDDKSPGHQAVCAEMTTSEPTTVSARDLSRLGHNMLRAWLLLLVAQAPRYGYELVAAMFAIGIESPNTGYVYRTLRELEDGGAVASYWEVSDRGGPPRRLYQVTASGEQNLHQLAGHVARLGEVLRRFEIVYGGSRPTAWSPAESAS